MLHRWFLGPPGFWLVLVKFVFPSLSVAQAWDNAAKISKAFGVGKFESLAIEKLMDKTSKPMVNALRDAVRVRGMRGFLTHETVAREVFCLAFSSGVQNLEAWNSQLTNLQDDALVSC